MVKATVAAPKMFVKVDGARIFPSSDLAALRGKKHAALKESNGILITALDLGQTLGLRQYAKFDSLYGNLGVNLTMHDSEKLPTAKFSSRLEIAVNFYAELCQAFGDKVAVESPWVFIKPAAKPKASGSRQLIESNTRGVVTCEILAPLGFVIDARIVNKLESELKPSVITNLDASTRTATLWDGLVAREVAFKDLPHDWKVLADITQQRYKAAECCDASEEVVSILAQCRMRLALNAAFQLREDDLQGIEVQTMPRKGVFALAKFKAKELRLVPRSMAVWTSPNKPTVPSNMGEVCKHPKTGAPIYGTIGQNVGLKLDASTDRPSIAPYWFVETTTDASMANLEYASMAVAVSTSCKKGDGDEVLMHVPVLQNTKKVDIGDELLIHKPALTRIRDDGDRPIPPPPAPKRARGRGRGK